MRKLILLLGLGVSLGGCTSLGISEVARTEVGTFRNQFMQANYNAADELLAKAQPVLEKSLPISISALTGINNANQPSSFGRLAAQQVATRFIHHEYQVIDPSAQNSSREVQATISGTYLRSENIIFVNLRIVRSKDNVVIAAYDYVHPADRETLSLLRAR